MGKPLTIRSNGQNGGSMRCSYCGSEYTGKITKRYCSDRCRLLGWKRDHIEILQGPDGEIVKIIRTKGTK